MFLEIVTPEAILFSSEITSVSVPGVNGEFQMLNNHAPVISTLKKGIVKIDAEDINSEELNDDFYKTEDNRIGFKIISGVLELKDNKVILLAE